MATVLHSYKSSKNMKTLATTLFTQTQIKQKNLTHTFTDTLNNNIKITTTQFFIIHVTTQQERVQLQNQKRNYKTGQHKAQNKYRKGQHAT
jgi:hypothetical protein